MFRCRKCQGRLMPGDATIDGYCTYCAGTVMARLQSRAEEAERRLGEALAITSPWPLWDILQRLVEAADHLYREHNCDRHGYEGVIAARDAGRRLVDVLRSAEGGGEMRIAEVRREALEEAARSLDGEACRRVALGEKCFGEMFATASSLVRALATQSPAGKAEYSVRASPGEAWIRRAADLEGDADILAGGQAPAGEPTCTGIAAAWCPIHGDCICRQLGEVFRADVDQACPLHGDNSTHADPAATERGEE